MAGVQALSAVPAPTPLEPWSLLRVEEVIRGLEGVVSVELRSNRFGPRLHVVSQAGVLELWLADRIQAALFVHFGRSVERGQLTIAQFAPAKRNGFPRGRGPEKPPLKVGRFVLVGLQMSSERRGTVNARVTIAWKGQQFEGAAGGSDVAHARLEALASATLRAIESAAWSVQGSERDRVFLHLEGTLVVPGTDQPSVLVSVNAVRGRETQTLAGAVGAGENANRAVVLATLQATDRWVRGQLRS